MALAGTLTVILLSTCCCCWCCKLFCTRGNKKSSYLTEDGYLMEPDKRFENIPRGILKKNVKREPENEVQEVCVEMKEEAATGVIQFEVETKCSNANLATAETVHSNTPVYKEDAKTAIRKEDSGTEQIWRAKSEPSVAVLGTKNQECSSDINSPTQRPGYINKGFVSSQELPAVETRQHAQNRITTAETTRSRSVEDLETLYHELYGDELGFFRSNLWGKDDDNDVQESGSCHAGREGNAQSPGEETRPRREQVDRVCMEISNEQLRDDGFQIFSFEDGTVFAEIHYNNNNNVSENYLS
ncbi:coadhesin-like [Porites lutea]|uniref:coadhesin-like n=1 Tax=Porites lutea TaxID=51062 RepID=UPI003CC591B4